MPLKITVMNTSECSENHRPGPFSRVVCVLWIYVNCCGLEYNTSQRSASAQVSLESRSDTLLGVVLWWVWFCMRFQYPKMLWLSNSCVKKTKNTWKSWFFPSQTEGTTVFSIKITNSEKSEIALSRAHQNDEKIETLWIWAVAVRCKQRFSLFGKTWNQEARRSSKHRFFQNFHTFEKKNMTFLSDLMKHRGTDTF